MAQKKINDHTLLQLIRDGNSLAGAARRLGVGRAFVLPFLIAVLQVQIIPRYNIVGLNRVAGCGFLLSPQSSALSPEHHRDDRAWNMSENNIWYVGLKGYH